jgi:hypothetical protein
MPVFEKRKSVPAKRTLQMQRLQSGCRRKQWSGECAREIPLKKGKRKFEKKYRKIINNICVCGTYSLPSRHSACTLGTNEPPST